MSTNEKPEVRVLASAESVNNMMSRRRFLGFTAGGAALFALAPGVVAACSKKKDGDSSGSDTDAIDTSGLTELSNKTLTIFSFAEYTAPEVLDAFESGTGATVTIDVFDSNEQARTKLETAGSGGSGYDLVVVTGPYIPEFVEAGLLETLDKAEIPNFSNLADEYLNQPWDPSNDHSVPKAWGTVGYVYDSSVITREMTTWQDFFDAMPEDGVSGKVSMLDSPRDLLGPPAWTLGIPWTTTDEAQLTQMGDFLLTNAAPYIGAFDSFPAPRVAAGELVLAHAWNGDARFAMIDGPETLRWVLPKPASELWIDNWCVAKGATNLEGAYEWINFCLTYDAAVADVEYTGYDTGLKDLESKLPEDTPFKDVIYFPSEDASMLEAGAVNSALPRQIEIYEQVKAAAGQ